MEGGGERGRSGEAILETSLWLHLNSCIAVVFSDVHCKIPVGPIILGLGVGGGGRWRLGGHSGKWGFGMSATSAFDSFEKHEYGRHA